MRLPMILGALLIAIAGFLTLALWQQANMRVRQQALHLRINALKNAEDPQQAPWSPTERQIHEERLDEMRRELNAIKAQGGSVK